MAKLNRSQISSVNLERAHAFRHALTPSEARLWAELSGGRLGCAFRRQVPIGRFIVDFLAPAARLVVEVDGGVHQERRSADESRDRKLGRAGYRVLRVTAKAVMAELPAVLQSIRDAPRE